MEYLIAGLIGILSGVASGLFGVGGGIIMVPAMVYFMKMDIKLAVGTSLMVIIPTAASGLFSAIIGGWANGVMGSAPVTREVRR